MKRPGFSSSKKFLNIIISYFSFHYSYCGGRKSYLHVPTYIAFPKQDRFTPIKVVQTFTTNFPFCQNLGKHSRKCFT